MRRLIAVTAVIAGLAVPATASAGWKVYGFHVFDGGTRIYEAVTVCTNHFAKINFQWRIDSRTRVLRRIKLYGWQDPGCTRWHHSIVDTFPSGTHWTRLRVSPRGAPRYVLTPWHRFYIN